MTKLILTSILVLLTFGCEKSAKNDESTPPNLTEEHQKSVPDESLSGNTKNQIKPVKEILPASAFMSAEWIDLMPKDDLDALLNPPSYIDDIVENSAQDQLSNSINNTAINGNDDRYQQALASTRVITTLNNAPIRIPAFIVPLEFDDEQRVTQFFMVPFFGACIHEPPPPPNQTIYVNYPQGFILKSLTEPYWFSGILKTSLIENETAIAAYTMEVHAFEPYMDE